MAFTPKQRKQMERDLLKRGTAVGPVTPELVATAKSLCFNACKINRNTDEQATEFTADFWPDFLTRAREHLAQRS